MLKQRAFISDSCARDSSSLTARFVWHASHIIEVILIQLDDLFFKRNYEKSIFGLLIPLPIVNGC